MNRRQRRIQKRRVRRVGLVLASGAMLGATAGLSGFASADQIIFQKLNGDCAVQWNRSSSDPTHWDRGFNPSQANDFWRTNDCGAPTTSVLGGKGYFK